MHIAVVLGTRPEAVKLCPVIGALEKKGFRVTVVSTGQHREMLTAALDAFSVRPQYNLALMRKGQTISEVTAAILEGLSPLLAKLSPDMVLVQGDTATAFAAAFSAFSLSIPVGHIEAGLRSFDMGSPFPEEFNRRAITLMASLHFAPTKRAKENLLREGFDGARVFVTGNTGIDALKTTVRMGYRHGILDALVGKRMVLLTAHRRESLDGDMEKAFLGIRTVLLRHPKVALVYPMHKNPKVRKIAKAVFEGLDNAYLIEPLELVDFHNFLAESYLVITDSGGVQEEAPYFGKPVLVIRNTTERQEGVEAGVLSLVGCESGDVERAFEELLDYPARYAAMSNGVSPFGDGNASERIAAILGDYLGEREGAKVASATLSASK